MLIHLAFLLAPAHAAPTISDCSAVTKSAPGVYDNESCAISTAACTFASGVLVCDAQTAGCDPDWTGAYYAVDYLKDRSISVFGTCEKLGTQNAEDFCCHIEDTQDEIDYFELYGQDVGDESIDFIWANGQSDEKNLRPTHTNNRWEATAIGRGGNDNIQGSNTTESEYVETLKGWDGHDGISGNQGNDIIYGGVGNDTMNGGHGDDRIYGSTGSDNIFGGPGNDQLHGQAWGDYIEGGTGDDLIWGHQGVDELYGQAGEDTIRGGNQGDEIWGGPDRDILYGQNGDDEIYGEAGNDDLMGNAGEDYLIGGSGNDRINGGDGDNDYLYGQDGDDYLHGGLGNDFLYGDGDDDFLCEEKGGLGTCYDSLLVGGAGTDTAWLGPGDGVCVSNVTLTGSGIQHAGSPEFDWSNFTGVAVDVYAWPNECWEVIDLDPHFP